MEQGKRFWILVGSASLIGFLFALILTSLSFWEMYQVLVFRGAYKPLASLLVTLCLYSVTLPISILIGWYWGVAWGAATPEQGKELVRYMWQQVPPLKRGIVSGVFAALWTLTVAIVISAALYEANGWRQIPALEQVTVAFMSGFTGFFLVASLRRFLDE